MFLSSCNAESSGQGPTSGIPQGEGYDFYVLSLSWSPSYCEIEGADANRQQCGGSADHAFVVHGLWPQHERGWPEFCDSPEPARVPNALVGDYLDIMPSAGLIGHQWRKHGSCTGMSQADYLAVTRAAFERITIPAEFEDPARRVTIAADAVESAFLDANPGLPADGMAVACSGRHLSEVRICMTRDLEFRSCPEVDVKACSIDNATMPAPGE